MAVGDLDRDVVAQSAMNQKLIEVESPEVTDYDDMELMEACKAWRREKRKSKPKRQKHDKPRESHHRD